MQNSPTEPADSRARWDRVKELFHAAVDLSKADRDRYLMEACGEDSGLRAGVEHLLAHHAAAGTFLDDPAWSPALEDRGALVAGEVLDDRFKIVRLIGSGGMGEVYLAFDSEIGEQIALKTIAPKLARDERMLHRLKKEIQLSRRVTHPNICRIFDLERTGSGPDGRLFLTMEFVAGETLAKYLQRRKALDMAEALPLIRQTSAGLAAAHEAGVLHRDLKPANIMLQMDGERVARVVITDFGVARSVALDPDSRATRTGEVPGTLAYMAPELLSGAPASPASDIYALGLIILEMCTGTTSLRPAGPGSGIDTLDPAWRAVILTCLDADQNRRFSNARDVARALDQPLGTRPVFWRPPVLSAALVAAVLAALALIFAYSRRPQYPHAAAMLVTPVVNFTHDSQLDGLTELLRQQLSQSAIISLWNPGRLPTVLREMRRSPEASIGPAEWREIALRENTPLVAFCNLTRLGDAYVLSVRVEQIGPNPARPQREWDQTERALSKPQLFDAIREVSLWIRKLNGESNAELSLHDRLPQDTTTSSWEALDLFHRAEQYKESGDSEKAVALLNQALITDPNFAMAHSRLGDILMSMRRDREALSHWAIALDEFHKQNLTKREEYRIRALYAIDSGDLSSAEGTLLVWLQEYSREYLPAYYLGYVYRMQGKLDESLRLLDTARDRRGDEYYISASLAQTYLARGAYNLVLDTCARLRKIEHPEAADQFEGAARLLGGDANAASQVFSHMTNSGVVSFRSRGYMLLARVEAERGRVAEAVAVLEKGIECDRDTNQSANRAEKLLALAYLRRNQPAMARGFALEATRAYASPDICAAAGVILARLGFVDLAASEASCIGSVAGSPRFQVMQLRLLGEIGLAKGQMRTAIRLLEQAAAQDAPLNPPDYLARALALSGDIERARMLYDEILSRPGILWQNAETGLPGVQREIMDESRALADRR
jgi:serine/threonine protein kinase